MKYKQETKQAVFEGYVAYINSSFEIFKDKEFPFDQVLSLSHFNEFVDIFREDPEGVINCIKEEVESNGMNFEDRMAKVDAIVKKNYPSAADD